MHRILATLAALALLPAHAAPQRMTTTSSITQVEGAGAEAEGGHRTITGVVHGVIDPQEPVVGLDALPRNAAGQYEYAARFELIVPALGLAPNEVAYIDAENRGTAISKGALGEFLKANHGAYARVQWQTGIAAGVPQSAQGVGLVIVRDFGRFLSGRAPQARIEGEFPPDRYNHLILGGISQSAWFVNTFIAEGFNEDPVTRRGVFDAAIAVDGAGGWLAINNLGAANGDEMRPYISPNGKPLSRRELMSRPRSDPLYVDIANYTDFYRLRAGLTSVRTSNAKFRRYDFPAGHVSGRGLTSARCNGGERIQQNPVGYQPYMRAIVLGMMKQIGVRSARSAVRLPRSTVFRLAESQPAASPGFNPLPGVFTPVPRVNADGWPAGGVSFPDAVYPVGRPVPPALAPAVTTGISETCGNSGGFQPFGKAALEARYGGRVQYLGRYDAQLDWLIQQGFVLEEDRIGMLETAGELYDQWP